ICISSTRRDWSTIEAMLPRYGTIHFAHSNAPDRVRRKEAATKSHLSSEPLYRPSLSRPSILVRRKHLYKQSVPSNHTSNLLLGMIVTVSAGWQDEGGFRRISSL